MLMLSRLQQSSRVSFSFSVTRNLMMWVRLFGLSLWIVGVIFSVFLVSISLQSFGRRCEKAAQSIERTSANGSKQKAGFGEGTPQQVRPVSETQFQLLKLWPQVDTCLSLFPSKTKIQISNWISFSKAGSAGANRSVSYCGGRRLHRICVPAPVLQRRCPARPRFVRGHGAVSRSRRLMQFSRCRYEELQAGRPSANSHGI